MNASSMPTLLGVNLAGAEFAPQDLGGAAGYAYVYPTCAEIDYFAAKGMNVIRLPFLWERVQPVQGEPLDAKQLSLLDGIVSYATARGVKVVLDVHNYGFGYGNLIGSTETPNAAFADLWGRLASHFAGNDDVLFGLMNEPHQQSAAQWVESANAAIAAIRATGATQQILVPGTYWSGAHSWVSSDNDTVLAPWIVDPGRNFAFEVHQYLDADSSGTQSGAVSAQIGVERLTAITQWAEATGNRLFLGEFGAGRDETSLATLSNMMDYVKAHSVWQGATYWAAGPWWGDYMFSVEPVGLGSPTVTDRPQMDVLENFLDGDKGGSIRGTDRADTLRGHFGPDVIDGLRGADRMEGGAGNDSFIVDQAGDRVVEAAGGGTDRVFASASYTLQAGQEIEGLQLLASTGSAALNLTGNEISQSLVGNNGNNVIDGGIGRDAMTGRGGNDTYLVDTLGDRIAEAAGGGTDTVLTRASYALAAGQEIEALQLLAVTGTARLNLSGNEFAQSLVGNNGANVLDGKGGADLLTGRGGADSFLFSTTLGAGNVDRLVDFSAADDTIRLAKHVFKALSAGPLTPSAFKDLGVVGAKVDADDRILYDRAEGVLSYDADGSGTKAVAVSFAIVETKVLLTAADFFVV